MAKFDRHVLASTDAWHAFERGDAALALRRWEDSPENGEDFVGAGRSIFVWALKGAEAGLHELARERADVELFARACDRGQVGAHVQKDVEALTRMLDVNEAFLLVLADRNEDFARAEQLARRALQGAVQPPEKVAAARTVGLVQLHRGHVERAMQTLEWAWRQQEPRWLRALCACYLGYGHALRRDAKASQASFARARSMDPRCRLLERYERLAAEALARGSTGRARDRAGA